MQKFSEIKYERPNIEEVKAQIYDFIKNFKNAKNYEEAKNLFLQYNKSTTNLSTMQTVAYIRNTIDTNDKFYEGEMNYFYEELPKLQIIDKQAGELLLSSPYKAEFAKEFGEDLIKGLEAQQKLADERIIPLQVEESQLGQEYSKITAGCTTDFRGEECNFYGLLKHMQSTDREERKEAFLAWANLYEKTSGELDRIYSRLVEIRVEMAKTLGFESYVDMAYLANGHYYYNAKDIAKFRQQVVDEIVPAVSTLYEKQRQRLGIDELYYYDEQLSFPEGNATPIGDKDYLVNCAKEMYEELSVETGEFINFMVKYDLFDLETKPGKHMGGYCTLLDEYKAPFIFSNFNGTSADVDVLTHEAGHAFQAYTASKFVPLTSQVWATNDVSEIHSMTMELFTFPWMDKFFGENAQKYRFSHLAEAIKVVPYLCLVDHYQHEVFANPTATAMERRKIWRDLEKVYMPWRKYDGNAFLEEGGFWMQKQHIFLFPFYYVDYALAQMGALEFYTKSKTDKDAAWSDYYNLCKAGGSKSYFNLLKTANLANPFEEGSVKRAASKVLQELLSAKY
ncbi:MAG: M3 family oligoendopeptidase [Clostridiales bacterium]|nr:M3 family oligoendopeptidase [Clostridiales bacterium]